MSDSGLQNASTPITQISYSIVIEPDGGCLIRATTARATPVIIGPFENESTAREWIAVSQD
jgi:hypothetical protein